MSAPTTLPPTIHPLADLRAARAELLTAVQAGRPSDLLIPGIDGEWCGRDVLVHMAIWLRELTMLIPELASGRAHQNTERWPDRPAWSETWNSDVHDVRPDAALAAVVTAHARLLDQVKRIDAAELRRRGPTPWGFETSGWELLAAEAAHERAHAARLAGHTRRPVHLFDVTRVDADLLLPAC